MLTRIYYCKVVPVSALVFMFQAFFRTSVDATVVSLPNLATEALHNRTSQTLWECSFQCWTSLCTARVKFWGPLLGTGLHQWTYTKPVKEWVFPPYVLLFLHPLCLLQSAPPPSDDLLPPPSCQNMRVAPLCHSEIRTETHGQSCFHTYCSRLKWVMTETENRN